MCSSCPLVEILEHIHPTIQKENSTHKPWLNEAFYSAPLWTIWLSSYGTKNTIFCFLIILIIVIFFYELILNSDMSPEYLI